MKDTVFRQCVEDRCTRILPPDHASMKGTGSRWYVRASRPGRTTVSRDSMKGTGLRRCVLDVVLVEFLRLVASMKGTAFTDASLVMGLVRKATKQPQ